MLAFDATPSVAQTEIAADTPTLSVGADVAAALDDGQQDLFLFRVPAGQSPRLFLFSVDGMVDTGGAVKVIDVELDAQGRVTAQQELASASRLPFDSQPIDPLGPLMLAAGDYLIGLAPTAAGSGDYSLSVEEWVAQRAPTELAEGVWSSLATPTETCHQMAAASPIDLELFGRGVEVRSANTGTRWNPVESGWRVSALQGGDAEFCVKATTATPWIARVTQQESAGTGQHEAEPNDDRAAAFRAAIDESLTGSLDRRGRTIDRDYIELPQSDTPLQINIDANGPIGYALVDASGAVVKRDGGSDQYSIGPVTTALARYLELTATSPAAYRMAVSLGMATRPGADLEPNDRPDQAVAMDVAQVGQGFLDQNDTDSFAIDVPTAGSLWRIQADGTSLASLRVLDASGTELGRRTDNAGERLRLSGLYLLPGRVVVQVSGEGPYWLRMVSQGPRDPARELEPNSDRDAAEELTVGGSRTGLLDAGDSDRFVFSVRQTERLRLQAQPPLGQPMVVELYAGLDRVFREQLTAPSALSDEREYLPGNYQVVLSGNGEPGLDDYKVELSAATPAASMRVIEEPAAPRAFAPQYGQRLSVSLEVDGNVPDGRLVASVAASEIGWSAGEVRRDDDRLNLELIVPANVPERPVRLRLQLLDGASAAGAAFLTVTPDVSAPLRRPFVDVSLPAGLFGGMNVASAALGGSIVRANGQPLPAPARGAVSPWRLIDGNASSRRGFFFTEPFGEPDFSIDLAGSDPVPVQGVLLTPRGQRDVFRTLKDFALETSTDGSTFREIYRGQLDAAAVEQSIVFPDVVSATHKRIVPLSAWDPTGSSRREAFLAELKVIAAQDFVVSDLKNLNIADPNRGGHVVWSEPAHAHLGAWDVALLTGENRPSVSLPQGQSTQFVVGFHEERHAWIDSVEWDGTRGTATPQMVRLFASDRTPIGPWWPVTDWSMDAATSSHRLDLAQPVRAKYLRFDIGPTDAGARPVLPTQIRVFEADVGEAPLLGEYGTHVDSGSLVFQGEGNDLPGLGSTGGASPAAAISLRLGSSIRSTVQRGVSEDWWSVDVHSVPASLVLQLNGERGIPELSVTDPQGRSLAVSELSPPADEITDELDGYHFAVQVSSPGVHRISVREPVPAMVVAFDTSGSVGSYQAQLWRTMRDIAQAADPDRFRVGFLPLGQEPIGDGLTGDAGLLLRSLGDYRGGIASSDAEGALLKALRMLSAEKGKRAVVLLTDADTPRNRELWSALHQTPVTVASLLITPDVESANSAQSRDLMQSWAAVNGGLFRSITDRVEFRDGFQEAVAVLRGPLSYSLTAEVEVLESLPPGMLEVTRDAPNGGDSAGSLLVLLDNSGSMLKRIDGMPRYRIAQTALKALVDVAEERETQLGLRVFGTKPDTCETLPLAPLGAPLAEVRNAINGLRPQNLARTPIAQALLAARDDLAGHTETTRVVIVTDGDETCDGDPSAAIEAVVSAGDFARVDIVGFAIDDDALTEQFTQWSLVGEGDYFDAQDGDALRGVLQGIVEDGFRMVSANGETWFGVVDGEAVELPPGGYQLILDTDDQPRDVTIRSGEINRVQL